VLGVLKAEGAYVPLELDYPDVRIAQILRTVQVPVIVTSAAALPRLAPLLEALPVMPAVACLGAAAAPVALAGGSPCWSEADYARHAAANLPRQAGADDVAYVIFTSGTTGQPKGVVVTHRPVVNVIAWLNEQWAVGPG